MTLNETLKQLEALGNAKVRAQNVKSGAGDNQFGVRLGDIVRRKGTSQRRCLLSDMTGSFVSNSIPSDRWPPSNRGYWKGLIPQPKNAMLWVATAF